MGPEEPQLAMPGSGVWKLQLLAGSTRMVQELAQAFQQNRFSFQNKLLPMFSRFMALSLNGAHCFIESLSCSCGPVHPSISTQP